MRREAFAMSSLTDGMSRIQVELVCGKTMGKKFIFGIRDLSTPLLGSLSF